MQPSPASAFRRAAAAHLSSLCSLGARAAHLDTAHAVCALRTLRPRKLAVVACPVVLPREAVRHQLCTHVSFSSKSIPVVDEALDDSEAIPGRGVHRIRRRDVDIGAWNQAPQSWLGSLGDESMYTAEDIQRWRSEFRFPRRQHSLAEFGYSDEELGEWRKGFDGLTNDDRITKEAFENYVSRKYDGLIPAALLKKKVGEFWLKFDRDHNDVIDFGEFMQAGLLFDVDYAKEKIRKHGLEATFNKYAVDGFLAEAQFFQLMLDFRFFVATATDVKKLVRAADLDRDGLINLSDFVQWVESGDQSLEFQAVHARDLRHLVPPEPSGN